MARPRARRRVFLVGSALLIGAFVAWRALRPPALPGYVVEERPLVQTVVATGRVISVARVQVGSEITATVAERRVQEGDRVAPGDVLVVLNAGDLAARVAEARAALQALTTSDRPRAQAALRQAEAQLQQATRERQRREDLAARALLAKETAEQAVEAEALAREAASQARLVAASFAPGSSAEAQARARLAAAEADLARTELRATVSGTVLTRAVEAGDLVQPGKVLLEIARDGVTEISVPVDEKNLGVLALDQPATCLTDAFPGQPFAGRVSYLSPAVDPRRGSIEMRVRVDPAPEYLRQDMTVSVSVETGRRPAALAVPNDAIRETSPGVATVLAVRDGRVHAVPVTPGLRGLAATEIVSGLAAGDRVLADAVNAAVTEGARVRVERRDAPAGDGAGATRRELPVSFD